MPKLAEKIPSVNLINTKDNKIIRLKQSDLEQKTIKANIFDPYLKQNIEYEGVMVKDFVNEYCKEAQKITMTAIDFYKIEFTKKDIVRHKLVSRIIEAYEKQAERDKKKEIKKI